MPLPEPKGRQREVLYLPATGHTVVLGTAGSGKTTLAIHRAAWLSGGTRNGAGRTLLVTFNKALATYLRHLKDNRVSNVQVETYHSFARGYLNSRGLMRYNAIIDEESRSALIANVVNTLRKSNPASVLKRNPAFFADEIAWIARHGLSSEQEYVEATRTGGEERRVDRRERPVIWKVADDYRALRTARGYDYDWSDIAVSANNELARDSTPRLYRHVVIDEGQDFSPSMIRSLAAAIPPDGSLTFFGDVAQQIFGRRMSWRSAGLSVRKPWQFCDNYRNSRQIAKLALKIAQMPYYSGTADLVEPVAPAADGPMPAIVRCKSLSDEVNFIIAQAVEASRTQSVAILVRRREHEALFRDRLPNRSIRLHREMLEWTSGAALYYGTFHAAKGLEFDTVILPFMSKERMPDPEDVLTYGEDEASVGDGRLLYVGVTRARTSLIVTYVGELSPLLPTEDGLTVTDSILM